MATIVEPGPQLPKHNADQCCWLGRIPTTVFCASPGVCSFAVCRLPRLPFHLHVFLQSVAFHFVIFCCFLFLLCVQQHTLLSPAATACSLAAAHKQQMNEVIKHVCRGNSLQHRIKTFPICCCGFVFVLFCFFLI